MLPSVKTLLRITRNDKARAKELRNLLETANSVGHILRKANALLDTHGIEYVTSDDFSIAKPMLAYCNTGDTYDATLAWDYVSRRFIVTSWGDYVEAKERQGYKFFR